MYRCPPQSSASAPTSSSLAIHGPFQKVTPKKLGRPTSPQTTYERNTSSIGLALLPPDVHGKSRHVPEKVKFATLATSSEGEVAQLEHGRIVELERQLELARANEKANAQTAKHAELELRKQAEQVLVQTSRVSQKDTELVSLQAKLDELLLSRTQDARALDQVQSALQKATADADERSQRACKQIGQYETELVEVRAELQARKSELEASPCTTARASALV